MVITKRVLNQSLAMAIVETGSIFVSDLERREAWRMEKRFSQLLGMRVKGYHEFYDADGKRYDGYSFKVIPNIPIGIYPARCPNCGFDLPKK